MNKQRQEEIIRVLQEKHASGSCPRCSNSQFEVIGEATITLSWESAPVGLPAFAPPAIPVILVSCTNCGFIAQHAARVLDLKR